MILKSKQITCPQCNSITDDLHYCEHCETIAIKTCPECGDTIWTHSEPGVNYGSEWCSNKDCNFFQNDMMSWEDIKQDYI